MTPFTDELARQHVDQLRAEAARQRLVRALRSDRHRQRSLTSSWRPAAAGALNRAAARLDPEAATSPAHPSDTSAVVLVPLLGSSAISARPTTAAPGVRPGSTAVDCVG